MPQPPGTRARDRIWLVYLAAVSAVAALYVLGPLNAGPVFNLIGASGAAATALGAYRHAPRGRFAWYAIAAGELLFVCGDITAYNYERLFGVALPFPSVADPMYLAMYPLVGAGLVALVRLSRQSKDRGLLIDALIITVGITTIAWVYLMAPYAHDASLTMFERAASLSYPAGDVLLLAVGAALALRGHRCTSAFLLGAALVSLLVTDSVYGWFVLHGGYETGGALDAGWIAFYALSGAAALHPSMSRLAEPVQLRAARLTRGRLVLLAATSLLAPSVSLVRVLLDQPREPVITVCSGVVFLLVLTRLVGVSRDHERATEDSVRRRYEERLAALVRHASDVVCILHADGRVAYISPSGLRLLGVPEQETGWPWTDVVHPGDVATIRAFLAALQPGGSSSVRYRLLDRDGVCRTMETLATNLLDHEAVSGIVLNTRDITDQRALEDRLAHQATHDALTGLPNRNLFLDRIAGALARSRRDGTVAAVVFIDLDGFKTINDTLGHAVGDVVLRGVAERIDEAVRASDSAARLGGDEFAVLLEGVAGQEEAEAVTRRVLASIGRPVHHDDRELRPAASAGIALATGADVSAEALLGEADAAMYQAKQRRDGSLAMFRPEMQRTLARDLELRSALRDAVAEDRIGLVFQPITCARSLAPVGVEALARWEHPRLGVISPGEFIPIAEESGLIVQMGRQLLERACAQVARMHAAQAPGGELWRMTVNVSAHQLASPTFTEDVSLALARAGVRPDRLMLELTESAMMSDVEVAVERLNALKALGVQLAVDDFGTGYSSLNMIRTVPIDVLKIDRTFIQALDDPTTRALTASIVELAGVLRLQTIAEGIENATQLRQVQELGCLGAQGFFLHRPMAAAEVEDLLAASAFELAT